MKHFFAYALLFCLSVVLATAQSQITTGAIQGTVSDTSGAVVSGATVKVRNLDTNLEKSLMTDANGRFVALLLPPGRYEVTINGKGFGTLVQQNINLTVGQTVTLVPQLKVAASTEQVVVTATPDIDTSKVESSSTLNERSIAQTPILGRKFEDFLTLTPGVSITQGPDGDEINFNGQRGIFNNVSLDGGDYNNGFFGEQAGGQRAAVDISLEAVKEFQVVASGASAEFGRSGGGIINVITKSGTNDFHGSIFHFQRLEALSSNTSDGKPLKDFHREQSGLTLGGPIQKNKQFFFIAFEQIGANLQRANLSEQTGSTPCSKPAPNVVTDAALISSNDDCTRLALLNFMRTPNATTGYAGQEEGLPVRRPTHNSAVLGKYDLNLNQRNQLSASYSFDASRKVNETFDVATYGNSANGTEGTSYIHAFNTNLISSLTNRWLNEAHFTFSKEERPRAAAKSNVPADTAMGFVTAFRFGNPFFLQPAVDENFKRYQIKDNVSLVTGAHTAKFGGDYLHSNNAQVFRGFFTGRYIFSDAIGFIRYASPTAAGGFGPSVQACSGGGYATISLGESCAGGGTTPLLLYLQGANGNGTPATDAAGASDINNEDFALFIQDKWQLFPNFTLSMGLRWEAQYMPDPTVPPSQTAYGQFLSNPLFPSDGTIPDQTKMFQPRLGIAWDLFKNQKSMFRASSGIFNAHQNMLTQVGSITTNGVQQNTIAGGLFANPTILPTWPGTCTTCTAAAPGTFPLFTGVRVFDRHYKNPRIYSTNFAFEQQIIPSWVAYADFTWNKGVYLTNFLNYNRADRASFFPFFGIALGEVQVSSSRANSLYRGLTLGVRKSFANHFQMDANYTVATDYDNDSNERDPFTDRSGPATATDPFPLHNDFSYSDRDIRNRFNLILSGDMPWGIQGNLRIQAHSAQPCTPLTPPDPKVCEGGTSGKRNTGRKDNMYSSVDWRLARPFKFGDRYAIIPMFELFNTFNSDNNINPLVSPGLFNFDGYLRQGVGDPRQAQFAIRFTF